MLTAIHVYANMVNVDEIFYQQPTVLWQIKGLHNAWIVSQFLLL